VIGCEGVLQFQEIGWEDHLKRPVEWVVNHIISAAAP